MITHDTIITIDTVPASAMVRRDLVCALGGALSGMAALPGPLAPIGAIVGAIGGQVARLPLKAAGACE